MDFSAYMSTIVSEVRQFGKAYVDSLVLPSDDTDHDNSNKGITINSAEEKQRVGVLSVISASSPAEEKMASFTSLSMTHPTNNNRGRNDDRHLSLCTLAASDGQKIGSDVIYGCSPSSTLTTSRSCEYNASLAFADGSGAVKTSATTSMKNSSLKPKKMSRSKFGAVKIQLDGDVATVTPPAAALNDSSSVASLPEQQKCANVSLHEQQGEALYSSSGYNINTTRPVGDMRSWFKKQDSILYLLSGSVEQHVMPAAFKWAQEALLEFVTNVTGEAILLAIKDTTDCNSVATAMPVKKEFSVKSALLLNDVPSESDWCRVETRLRSFAKHITPREVFGEFSSFGNSEAVSSFCPIASNDVELPHEVVLSLAVGGVAMRQALDEALATAKRLCCEHHLQSLLLLSPHLESRKVFLRGILEFLTQSHARLVRTAAAIAVGLSHNENKKGNPSCTEPQEQFKKEELGGFILEMTRVYCKEVVEADAEWKRRGKGSDSVGEQGNVGVAVDDSVDLGVMEIAMNNVTVTLWLLREAMVMILLIVWAILYNHK